VGVPRGRRNKMRERVWARRTQCAEDGGERDSYRHAKRRGPRQTASGAPNPKRQRTDKGYRDREPLLACAVECRDYWRMTNLLCKICMVSSAALARASGEPEDD